MSPTRARVEERLTSAQASGDPAPLFEPEAVADALTLLREVTPSPDGGIDLSALTVVWLTFWLRCQEARGQDAQRDLRIAANIQGFLARRVPADIGLPDGVREHAEADPLCDVRLAYVVASAHGEFAVSTPDLTPALRLASLDRALAWSSVASRGAAGDEGAFIETTLHLMALQTARFDLAADPASLAAAARAALAVHARLTPHDPEQAEVVGAVLAAIVSAALMLGDPPLAEVERLIGAAPGEAVPEVTTAMLGSLRGIHAEPVTWPGALDARAGAVIVDHGMREQHAGLLACAIRRLRAALADTSADHPAYTEVANMLGLALVRFGDERDDAAAVSEGTALLARVRGPLGDLVEQLRDLATPGLLAAVELGAIACDIALAQSAAGAQESVGDEQLHRYRAALRGLPAEWPDRYAYVAVLAAAAGTRALALQEAQPARAAELTAEARALTSEAETTAPADFAPRLLLREDDFAAALALTTMMIPWGRLTASLRDGLPEGPAVAAIADAFESMDEALAEGVDAELLTALGSLHLDGPEHFDSDIAHLRTLLAKTKDDEDYRDLHWALAQALTGLLRASSKPPQDSPRPGQPYPPGFDEVVSAFLAALRGDLKHYMRQPDARERLEAAAELAAASSPDDRADPIGAMTAVLRKLLVSSNILAEDLDVTQINHIKELVRQFQELADQHGPGGGENFQPAAEAINVLLQGMPELFEAIPEGRAAEVQTDQVVRFRKLVGALPADHPALPVLQAQLAIQLAGEAVYLRDSDPARAASLLAEADDLVERVGASTHEMVVDMLRGHMGYARATVEGSEGSPHPLARPGPSAETIRRALEEAGYAEPDVRAMLRDPQIPVWLRVSSGFAAAFRTLAAALRDGRADGRRIGQGLSYAEEAADLLARVTDRGSDQRSAEHALAAYAGELPRAFISAVLGTAHALRAAAHPDDPAASSMVTGPLVDRAAALGERVRGLLLSRQLESHTDLRDLSSAHPELARRFEDLTEQLAADPEALAKLHPDDSPPQAGRVAWARMVRYRASSELDSLLDEIRGEDGFGAFLRPLAAGQLRELAGEGPVVVLGHPPLLPGTQANAPQRPHALIVTTEAITSLRLDVEPARVTEAARELRDAIDVINARGRNRPSIGHLRAAGGVLREILSWTWHSVVGPVLSAAGVHDTVPTGAPWPRIWWIPTGAFNALPLHAAQCTLPGCAHGDCGAALDAVVSSYVPGFRTLAHARAQSADLPPDAGGALLVAATDDDLPGARTAAEYAAGRLGAAGPLVGRAATIDAVQSSLTAATWAHFGCHATSDPAQPSGGALHLPSGEPLSVLQLCRIRPRAARLAFLAACGTARTSERLADEAIHLTSAFLIAGFPGAVGTLWEIGSAEAEYVTREFYRRVTGEGAGTPAGALHHTVRKLRNEHPDRPHTWAAYVHAGV